MALLNPKKLGLGDVEFFSGAEGRQMRKERERERERERSVIGSSKQLAEK